MDTATALPWLVKLTYTLDGAEIAPEELGGKSGALTIRLQVSRNPDCTGDFFDQYALQVTMTLDTDRAQNIVADGATMANVGSNKQLSYILLPGSDSDVTVTADVTDFAMNAISLNGVKQSMRRTIRLVSVKPIKVKVQLCIFPACRKARKIIFEPIQKTNILNA